MDKEAAQTAATLSTSNLRALDGEVIGSFRGEEYYLYTEDIQGSTGEILDDSLSTKNTYSYTDFGEVTVTASEANGNTSLVANEICYTGAIYDESTGLHYLNARYYDPENGRFISQDTYRGDKNEISQWHLYAYCANNPINYTDPSGHASSGTKYFNGEIKFAFLAVDASVWGYKKGKDAWSYFKKKGWKEFIKSKGFKNLFQKRILQISAIPVLQFLWDVYTAASFIGAYCGIKGIRVLYYLTLKSFKKHQASRVVTGWKTSKMDFDVGVY